MNTKEKIEQELRKLQAARDSAMYKNIKDQAVAQAIFDTKNELLLQHTFFLESILKDIH